MRHNVSIVIPSYNTEKTIVQCLDSIERQQVAPHEVIVVDDGSTDSTIELLKPYNIRVIKNSTNRGPAYARNLGANHATGDLLFFIDADVALDPEALGNLLEEYESRPHVTGICGIYEKDPLLPAGPVGRYRTMQTFYDYARAADKPISLFVSFIGSIRRESFLSAGGYDSRYKKADVEDWELGHRLSEGRHLIHLSSKVKGRHDDVDNYWQLVSTLARRAYLYAPLVLKRKKLDHGYVGKKKALSTVLALSSLLVLPTGAVTPAFFLAVGFLANEFGFLRFVAREAGFAFSLRSLVFHYSAHVAMGLGFVIGLLFRRTTRARPA